MLILLSTASIIWGFTHSSLFYLKFIFMLGVQWGFPGGSMVKNPPANAGDTDLIPGFGKSPGVGNGNPLHYSCLDSSTDREAW